MLINKTRSRQGLSVQTKGRPTIIRILSSLGPDASPISISKLKEGPELTL